MSPPNQPLQALTTLLEGHGPRWRVLHANGAIEPFDGQKLIGSLINAEVPLLEAVRLYAAFVREISGRYPSGDVPLSEVRGTVVTLLMRLPHGDRTLWLSNYENLFAVEHDFPDDEGLVPPDDDRFLDASSNRQLYGYLTRLVREELRVPERTGPGSGRRDAIEDLVDRVARIVRLCGFHRVPRSFLETLVQTLAEHSSRFVLPGHQRSPEEHERSLRAVEDLLGAASLYARSAEHRGGLGSALILATAPAAAVFLQEWGFLPRVGPEAALRQMDAILASGERYAASSSRKDLPVAVAYRELDHLYASFGLRARDLSSATQSVLRAAGLADDASAPAPRTETDAHAAVAEAARLVELVRLGVHAAPQMTKLRDTLVGPQFDPDAARAALLRVLDRHGLRATVEPSQPDQIRVTMTARSLIGEFGSGIVLRLTDRPLDSLAQDVRDVLASLPPHGDTVVFLVCRALDAPAGHPTPKLPAASVEDLRRAAQNQGRIVVPIAARRLLACLTTRAEFLEVLGDIVDRTYPQLLSNTPRTASESTGA